MSGMQRPETYLKRAREAGEMAQAEHDLEAKAALLAIAETWQTLATTAAEKTKRTKTPALDEAS